MRRLLALRCCGGGGGDCDIDHPVVGPGANMSALVTVGLWLWMAVSC